LGVRLATTLPAMSRPSSSAPRLQITFMSNAFPARHANNVTEYIFPRSSGGGRLMYIHY
jgi:hypothetical protein